MPYLVADTPERREQWYDYWCRSAHGPPPVRYTKAGGFLTDPVLRAALDRAITDGQVTIVKESVRFLYLAPGPQTATAAPAPSIRG